MGDKFKVFASTIGKPYGIVLPTEYEDREQAQAQANAAGGKVLAEDDWHKYEAFSRAIVNRTEYFAKETQRVAEKVARNAVAIQKLWEHGFDKVYMDSWGDIEGFGYLTVKDLPKVYKAIGKIKKTHTSVHDKKKREILVNMESDKFPGVRMSYVKKVPRKSKANPAGPRCKFVTVRPDPYTTLVCS